MPHVLIVSARFYPDIADALEAGAVAELEKRGATWDKAEVPGAFEIPAAIAIGHRAGAYDGYVALGCVIRGETSHYDYVCAESARGVNSLAIDYGAAVGYGILTTEDRDQAWARAAVNSGNKGAYAAGACLDLVALKRRFSVA